MMGMETTRWISTPPPWVALEKTIGRKVKAKSAAPIIDSFMGLPEGWHYGEGRGATEAAAKAAKKVDTLFLETEARTIEAFPGIDGGVAVYGFYEDQHVEVVCHPGGRRMELYREIDDEPVYENDDIALDDVIDYVEGLSWGSKS